MGISSIVRTGVPLGIIMNATCCRRKPIRAEFEIRILYHPSANSPLDLYHALRVSTGGRDGINANVRIIRCPHRHAATGIIMNATCCTAEAHSG